MTSEVFDAKGSTVTLSVILAANGAPNHFLVTSTTGYRATLAACTCDRKPCLKTGQGCSRRDHCHGGFGLRHLEHARNFASQVAKTYGSADTGRNRGPLSVRRQSKMTEQEWSAARGEIDWTDVG